MNVAGERSFEAPRQAVWEVLNDPASMAKTMPGVESFDVHDEKRWTANVKIPLGLGGLRMKIDMDKTEERELEFAALHVKGQGVGAMLNMQTSFELSDEGAGTRMKWAADVKLAGPVGSMGQRVLQPIVNQQVQHVLKALDRQVQERAAGSSAGGAPTQGGGESSSGEGHAGAPPPSTSVEAVRSEGPTDYGPPADSDREPEPETGTSGADEGINPLSPETYEPEPEGPTTSTEDSE
ncbi:MAG: CoxG family protein [Gaiellaceae bacterium]